MPGKKTSSPRIDSAVSKGVNFEITLADMARRSERRAWFIASAATLLSTILAAGYFYMLPLKERVPYLIMADAYILQSTNGTGLFALQGAPSDPAHNRVHLDKAQAAAEPIEKSTAQLQQETAVVQIQQQEREQRRSMAISPSLCTR